jgi:RNA recognition motif-containing protein
LISVKRLTKNVRTQHLIEIFGHFGKVLRAEIPAEVRANLANNYSIVEF